MSCHVIDEPVMTSTRRHRDAVDVLRNSRLLRDHDLPPGSRRVGRGSADDMGALKIKPSGTRTRLSALRCLREPHHVHAAERRLRTGLSVILSGALCPMKKADMLTYVRSMMSRSRSRTARHGGKQGRCAAQEIGRCKFWQAPLTKMLGPASAVPAVCRPGSGEHHHACWCWR